MTTKIYLHPAVQILLPLALVGGLGLTASLGLGQTATVVSVVPAQARAALSETVRLSITVQGVSALDAYQFDLVYSPTLAHADGAAVADFLGGTGRTVIPLGPTLDQAAGRVQLGAFSFGGAAGPDGAGVLAVITLTTYLTPGVTPLTLQNVQLLDTHARISTLSSGRLTIGNRAPLTPSQPIPAHQAGDVSRAPILYWQCSDPDEDPLIYTVAFGARNPPPLIANGVTTTTYTPGALVSQTVYYWHITATDGLSETAGPLWVFITTVALSPERDFCGTPRSGDAPLAVQFTSIVTGAVTDYAWTFGDGRVANTPHPTHTYQNAGSFGMTLVVTGPGGTTQAVKPGYITVNPPAGAPTATFSADVVTGTIPLTITFTAVTSGTVESWQWNFGDGGMAATGSVVQHTYQMPGIFDVCLIVSNTHGSYTVNRPDYITVMVMPTYNLSVQTVGQGAVTLTPPGGVYAAGMPVTLTATPAVDWHFGGWTGALNTVNPVEHLTMDGDQVVTATFTQELVITHTLIVNVIGQGTVIPSGGVYLTGVTVTLTATPDTGWRFATWSGAATGTLSQTQVVMTADQVVTATFALVTDTRRIYLPLVLRQAAGQM